MSNGADPLEQTARLEGRIKKAEQAERDKRAAWTELEADARRVDENMARLKALRIAKEEAEAKTAQAEKAAKAAKTSPKRRKLAAAT